MRSDVPTRKGSDEPGFPRTPVAVLHPALRF